MRKAIIVTLLLACLPALVVAQSFNMPPPGGVMVIGCSFNTTPITMTMGNTGYVQCNTDGVIPTAPGPVATGSGNAGYPANATPAITSSSGSTGAVNATIGSSAGIVTYLCGFTISANATSAMAANASVTGVKGGTLTFLQPIAATPAVATLTETFNPCLPASAANTGIAIVSAAAGSGGTTTVEASGYTQ